MPNDAQSNDGLLLDYKARQMILKALRCQIAVWESQSEDVLGEDADADLQNDLLYAEGLLASLQDEFATR